MHNLFLPTLKELCGEYGCRSSCGCRIISQKAGVQQGEPQHPGHEEQLSLSPLGPKSQQNCLFPTRMDTSGGHCSHSETQMKGKSKQALISPPFPAAFQPLWPPRKALAEQQLSPGDRSGLPRTDTHHNSSDTELWRFSGGPHGSRSSSQAQRGMCHVTTSPFGKISLFFAPGNLEGTGLLQHYSN